MLWLFDKYIGLWINYNREQSFGEIKTPLFLPLPSTTIIFSNIRLLKKKSNTIESAKIGENNEVWTEFLFW